MTVTMLSNHELLTHAKALALKERQVTADFLEHLVEIERRRLYLSSHPSLFAYLTEELHFSESVAGVRVQAMRAVAKFPLLLPHLRSGALHLSGLSLIASILTPDNVEAVVKAASFQSVREIEKLLVRYAPRKAVKVAVTAQRQGGAGEIFTAVDIDVAPKAKKLEIKPCTETTYNIKFPASAAFVEVLDELRALLSHKYRKDQLEEILREAVVSYLKKPHRQGRLRPRRRAELKSKLPKSPLSWRLSLQRQLGASLLTRRRRLKSRRVLPLK
jgi:hypothetical protein